MPLRLPLAGLLLLAAMLPMAQAAEPLRLCMPDVDIPPHVSSDPARPGLLERLLKDSAQAAGLTVTTLRQPPARCRQALEQAVVDVTLLSAVPSNFAMAEFPMHGAQVDVERRLASTQLIAVRRRGETALQWDGKSFQPPAPVLGVRRGMQVYQQLLAPLRLSADDGATSGDQLLRKLAAGRIDMALLSRGEFELLQRAAPRSLEALATPFADVDYYLGVRRSRTAEQRAQVEAWWAAIGRMRELPAYQPSAY